MRRQLIVGYLFLVQVIVGASSCGAVSSQAQYGPYRGQIVDVETKKPIAGAAVIAVWWEAVFNPVQGKQEFYDAKEAVTDADGRFEISKLDVPPWKLGVQPGQITYFAPGYIPVREVVTPPNGEPFVVPTIVELRRAKDREERIQFQRRLPPSVPFKKMPTFLKVFNAERLNLGFQPFGETGATK